jgi:hypothetical protein
MVVAAARLMVGMAVMQVHLLSKNYIAASAQHSDLTVLQGDIDSLLKEESSCRPALGGPAVFGGAATPSAQKFIPATNFTNSAKPNPIMLYQKNGSTPFISSTLPAGNPANKFGKLTITAINLVLLRAVPNSTDTFLVQMFITGQKTADLIGARTLLRSDIKLSVKIDVANNIISCSSMTFLGTDLQPLPVCNPGEALHSNGGHIRCVPTICPAPLTASGYQFWGGVICL